MKPVDVVADRFAVERRAGAGVMGVLHRAFDRVTGEVMALETVARGRARTHTAIVRYVAHGTTSGDPSISWCAPRP